MLERFYPGIRRNIHKLLIILLGVLFVAIMWIYARFVYTMYTTFDNVRDIEIQNISETAGTIDKNIRLYVGDIKTDLYLFLKNNPEMRKRLNRLLSIYVNREIRYVYVIRKDKRGAYRYLLDGSKPKRERGAFNQIFIPLKVSLWKRCFSTGKDVYATQNNIRVLWITYLHPLIFHKKMQGVLVLDVSTLAYEKLRETLIPLKRYLKYLLLFVLLVVVVTTTELLLFVRERKTGRVDALTQLYNRSYLRDQEKSINLKTIAVAMADIDHFKVINDTYGHQIGDAVLKNIAKRLTMYTRADDIVIRYGGEEFVIIFKNYRGMEDQNEADNIVEVAKRVQRQVSMNPIRVSGLKIRVTISMGLDPFTFKRSSLMESIIIADKMLYKAKQNSRNRVEVAEE